MPEVDFHDPDLESFWGEYFDVLVRFYGKTSSEAAEIVADVRLRFGCDEPGFDPIDSMLFHDWPFQWIERRFGPVTGVAEYYLNKYGYGDS